MDVKMRLAFSKVGRAVYISHLDLMRVFQRAFMRAELPLRFSEGYNPHMMVSIALPLSVGVESVCERLDVGMLGGASGQPLCQTLNALLPEGIAVTDAQPAQRSFQDIAAVRTKLHLRTSCKIDDLYSLFSRAVLVDKKSKRAVKETDITQMISRFSFVEIDSGEILAEMDLSAQNPTLNPEYVVKAIARDLDPNVIAVLRRTALLDAGGTAFDLMK